MRKLPWKKLSRPVKVLILLVGFLATSLLLYIFVGTPPLSDEHRYRRAEKANLVGPAEILDILELEPVNMHNSCDRMIIADTGDAVIMYLWHTQEDYLEYLVYREKMGDITVYAAPCARGIDTWELADEIKLPVLLFDNFPQAVRAELDLTLWADRDDDFTFSKDYALEARREKPGYFCFYIYASDFTRSDDDEGAVLASFSKFTSGETSNSISPMTEIPATVRLFDADGRLIHEETVSIRHVSGEAHYERSDLPED